MSTPRIPVPAQLMMSVMSAQWDEVWPELKERLEEHFGTIDYESPCLPFDHTSYYNAELGESISRKFVGFKQLFQQDTLVDIKLYTNQLENHFARSDNRRRVNLDPGFITQERLVLATGKNFTHRIYLGQGIFGDLTLMYQGKTWQVFPWTFPDYKSKETQAHITALRRMHAFKLRSNHADEHDRIWTMSD
ncbi:DUF4416 family protein [Desulfovibrio inopinatus]|uniref:DUF4416 family protein n=1 Tax=Desulfovibrio inopinatus TaxID=102109 RepID=UPI0004254E2A|nr:DUF4416 family protein [Desulfovibrio inopinatus]